MVTDLLKDPEKRRGMRAALHKWPSRIRRSASAILTGWPPENDKKERWPWIQKEQRRPAPAEEGHRRQNARREKPVQNARTRAQTRSRTAPQTRRPSGGRCGKRNVPQVVYTPAQTISFRRMLLRILVVAAVALALCLSLSIFFKVRTVTVAGAEKYTPGP